MKHRCALLLILPLLSIGLLAACGQRGPLTLPSKPAAASNPVKADGAAASPAPATK